MLLRRRMSHGSTGMVMLVTCVLVLVLWTCDVTCRNRLTFSRVRFKAGEFYHPESPPVSLQSECTNYNEEETTRITKMKTYQKVNNETGTGIYYNYMTILDNQLYIAAMNYIFKFPRTDITKPLSELYHPIDKKRYDECLEIYSLIIVPEFHCQNHFHIVMPNKTTAYNRTVLYTCGTYGYTPKGYLIDAETLEIVEQKEENMVQLMCPSVPLSNITYLYAEKGNPGGLEALYSGSSTENKNTLSYISRARMLRPDKSEESDFVKSLERKYGTLFSNWDTDFVKSFDMGDYVYFFLRTRAYPRRLSKEYSYVARVCKSDRGGRIFSRLWTTYLMMQLRCEIFNTIYVYHEIQDVTRVGDVFYGIFTSKENDRPGTVICRYAHWKLEDYFEGPKYMTPEGAKEDKHELYKCNASVDTRKFDIKRLHINVQFWMIYERAPEKGDSFVFFLDNVWLRQIVYDEKSPNDTARLYVGSNDGRIFQLIYPNKQDYEMYVTAVFKPNPHHEPVLKMLFDSDNNNLFVGYKSALYKMQIPRTLCHEYIQADVCMLNPLCRWRLSADKCEVSTGPENGTLNYTDMYFIWPAQRRVLSTGYDAKGYWTRVYETVNQAWRRVLKLTDISRDIELALDSSHTFKPDMSKYLCYTKPLNWYHNDTKVTYLAGGNYLIDTDYQMTIKRTRWESAGTYVAIDNFGVVFINVTVSTVPAATPKEMWTYKFNEWCDEFDKYKTKINQWTSKCNP